MGRELHSRRSTGPRRSSGRAALVVSLVAALGVACGGAAPSGAGAPGGAGRTSSARLVDASAKDVVAAVARARGDVVLVNVWATWCEPCREEFPDLMRLRREMSGKPFALILVSADFPDVRPDVLRFLTQFGVDFPTFLKTQRDTEFINGLDPRWSGALPANLLFGVDGAERGFWEGKADYATFVQRVSALLPAGAARPASALREGGNPSNRRGA